MKLETSLQSSKWIKTSPVLADISSMMPARSYTDLFIVVDGLGALALENHLAHTKFFRNQRNIKLRHTVLPSTTSTVLTSFFTASSPMQHGLIGYTSFLPAQNDVINNLSGVCLSTNEVLTSSNWVLKSAIGQEVFRGGFAVGPKKYDGSFLSSILHPHLPMVVYQNWDGFIGAIRYAFKKCKESELIYVHLPQVDQAGHKYGVGSSAWLAALEQVDQQIQLMINNFEKLAPGNLRITITSDHGMVNANLAQIIDLKELEPKIGKILAVSGEGRSLQLKFQNQSHDFDALARELEARTEGHCVLLSKAQLLEAKLFGEANPQAAKRLGEVIIFATGEYQFTHSEYINPISLKQLGVHGSLTDQEMLVPIIQIT